MPKLPEGFEIIDSPAASLPQGFNILSPGAEKQEKFAMQTDPRNIPEGFQVVQDPITPDAFGSELRAPKPLEGVTRALKGMAGIPINAAAGIYNELAANTPAQIGQLMSAAEDLTNVNIFGNMPEQLQIQADRTTLTPERQSPAEQFAQKAGGAVGSSLKSVSMGPGGAGAAYGALEAADVYQTARDKGRGRLDAVVAALPAGVFNYVLEYAGVERLLKGPEIKAGTSALKRLATNLGYGAAVEGLEEGSQTVSTDWVKEMNNLQNETLGQLAKKVNESMILGAIGGASSSVILSKLEQGGAKEIFKKAGMDEQQSTQALGKLAVKIQEEAQRAPQPVAPDVSKEQTQIQAGVQEQDARQARYVATVDKAIADGLTRDQANDLAVGMLNNTMVAPQDEAAYIAHFKNALVNKLPVDQAVQYADMKIRNAKIAQEQQQPAEEVNAANGTARLRGKYVDAIVTRSAKEPGKWQTTILQKDGSPSGDSIRNSFDEALTEARQTTGVLTKEQESAGRIFDQQPAPVQVPEGFQVVGEQQEAPVPFQETSEIQERPSIEQEALKFDRADDFINNQGRLNISVFASEDQIKQMKKYGNVEARKIPGKPAYNITIGKDWGVDRITLQDLFSVFGDNSVKMSREYMNKVQYPNGMKREDLKSLWNKAHGVVTGGPTQEELKAAWNKAHGVSTGSAPGQQEQEIQERPSIEREALKYKTPEEFIKAQAQYKHGTHGKFDVFMTPQEMPEELAQEVLGGGQNTFGIYFTDTKDFASQFGKNIVEAKLDLKKPLDLTNVKTFENLVDLLPVDKKKNALDLRNVKLDSRFDDDYFTDDIYRALEKLVHRYELLPKIKSKGYDGIIFNDRENGKRGVTTIVFDKSQIKTKADLTAIWNKAHGKTLTNQPGQGIVQPTQNEVEAAYGSKEKADKAIDEAGQQILDLQFTEGPTDPTLQSSNISPRQRALEGEYSRVAEGFTKNRSIIYSQQIVSDTRSGTQMRQVADLFTLIRNPHIEHLSVVYVKGGKIVHFDIVSSGDNTMVNTNDSLFKSMLKDSLDRIRPDTWYMVHNHPGGDSRPSPDDISNAEAVIREYGPKFQGHIVLNGGEFAFVDVNILDRSGNVSPQVSFHKYSAGELESFHAGKDRIFETDPDDRKRYFNKVSYIATIGKYNYTKSKYAVMYITADGHVIDVEHINVTKENMFLKIMNGLESRTQAAGYIININREFGKPGSYLPINYNILPTGFGGTVNTWVDLNGVAHAHARGKKSYEEINIKAVMPAMHNIKRIASNIPDIGGKRIKLSSLIRKLGGLDPKKLAKDYNVRDLIGDGLLPVLRKNGWALDEIVDRLQAEGVIIPEDVNPSDWVIEELKRQAGKKVEKSLESKYDEGYNKAAERTYENEKLIANKEVEKYGYSNAEIIEAERDLEADFEADVGREGVQEEAISPAIYFSDEELALLKQADLPLPAPIANRISGTRTEGTPDLIPGVSMTQPGNAPPIGRGGIQAPSMSEEEYGKTKRKGIFWLTRETFRRNIESIFPKNVADRILAYASSPVMKNEYERISWLNKVRTDTAALLKKLGIGLYDKLDKPIEFEDEAGNKFKITTLDSAIQAYGEKVIDLKTLQNGTKKWHEVVQASEYFRDLYNKIIEKWNTSLRNFGYQPVPRRKDYFRHFRAMGGILDQFGFIFKGGDLPSAIAGLTEWFKPGRPFTTAQLKRLGVRTDYSAIKGFDNYLNSVSQQIYHTDSVQRIRMLEAYMRVVDPEGTKLSAFNNYLREYGNLLAGKTSAIDRSVESSFIGRPALKFLEAVRKRVSANMISANIGASLTNLIPLLTQLPTIVSPASLAKGLHEGAISPIKADFATIDGMKSSFLTRRFPVKEIFKTRGEKVGNALGFFFETIDAYTSVATTAAIYYNNLAKGMNQEEAMRQADIEAGKLITDRSFGQLPNLFRSKLLGPITQFQIEVNNMASWIGKDLKVAHRGDRKKHAAALALFFMLSFMFNSIFEKLTGRRPTIDPIHATLILMGMDDQAYKSKQGVKTLKPFSERASLASQDVIENMPFGNTLIKIFGPLAGWKAQGGGRLPIEAVLPRGFSIKEWSKPVLNLGMPMAGGQIRKSLDGITAYATKGKFNSFGGYLDYQLGADSKKPKFTVEQTPANLARMAVFGPSASAEAKKYYAGRI